MIKDIKIEQNTTAITVNDIDGEWVGKLLQYDWSGKHIVRILPVAINFITTNNILKIKVTIAEQTLEATVQFKDGYVYVEDDLTFTLDKLYSNNPKETSLNHTLFTLSMQKKELEGSTYLTGLVDTFIESWMEYGAPMSLVLKEKEAIEVLDEDMLDALLAQEDQFIKLYPVPFNEQLTVQYQLETADNVYVELVSLNGINKIVIQPNKLQQAGDYTYTIPVNTNLPKGLYVVRIMAGNKLRTRMIIKDNDN